MGIFHFKAIQLLGCPYFKILESTTTLVSRTAPPLQTAFLLPKARGVELPREAQGAVAHEGSQLQNQPQRSEGLNFMGHDISIISIIAINIIVQINYD